MEEEDVLQLLGSELGRDRGDGLKRLVRRDEHSDAWGSVEEARESRAVDDTDDAGKTGQAGRIGGVTG